MKVMQTLGRHGGAQEGVFQYKRSAAGVVIDSAVGQANLNPPQITLTHAEWATILDAIESAASGVFRLTGAGQFESLPNQSLYQLLSTAVPHPGGGWNWHDSWKAYVCSVLEHEGSIDLYHGPVGPHVSLFIGLARDIP